MRVVLIGLITGVLIATFVLIYAWNALALPADQPLSETTFVRDRNGNQIAEFNAGEKRTKVDLEQVPEVLRQAVLATEDRSFYDHSGVDPRGIARALWVDIREGGATQGGSTLSQQYIKTTYVGTDVTLERKVKEAILAVKLEQRYGKDEILERYLNAIYFGRGAYGVQVASQSYFDKDVEQLELKEAAYLAGLIRAPELADVSNDPDEAKSRRDLTLNSMVETGYITPSERDEVVELDVGSYTSDRSAADEATTVTGNGTQYFVDYVRRTLVQRYGEQRVLSGGLEVTTTLDGNLQAQGYQTIYGNNLTNPDGPSGALVSVDKDGGIVAMVGGRDWEQSQVNLAAGRDGGGSGRQPGSTFKPFTFAAAMEEGICRKEAYNGPAQMVFPGADNGRDWTVNNYESQGFGRIDLVQATANSVNTVYAQLNEEIGPRRTADMARAAGVVSPVDTNISNVLGTDSVTPVEMAGAYMTFARDGVRVPTTPIVEVKTSDGDILETLQPEQARVMSQSTAQNVNFALQQVVRSGSGRSAALNTPVAGKTGTTSDNTDAWFVGYTPTLSTAVWMGYPEGAQPMPGVSGGGLPASMFGQYMRAVAPQNSGNFTSPPDCAPENGLFPNFPPESPFDGDQEEENGDGFPDEEPGSGEDEDTRGFLEDLDRIFGDRSNRGNGNRGEEAPGQSDPGADEDAAGGRLGDIFSEDAEAG
jgi:1A family penicillin-binding protein